MDSVNTKCALGIVMDACPEVEEVELRCVKASSTFIMSGATSHAAALIG